MNSQKLIPYKILTQLKRELWEHKTGFIRVPLAIALLWTLFACYALVNHESLRSSVHMEIEINENQSSEDPVDNRDDFSREIESLIKKDNKQPEFLADSLAVAINIQNAFLMIVFFFVLITYAHSTLFDDRANREILFWRSMPVSETQNVLTKLAMIMLVAPGIILLLNIASGLIVLLVGSLAFDEAARFSAAEALLLPFEVFGATAFQLLILLPIIGWIFFASAFAKKSPFLISALVPMSALFVDRLLRSTLEINLHIKDLFLTYLETLQGFQPGPLPDFILQRGLLAIAVGCLLIVATIWLRNNRYEF